MMVLYVVYPVAPLPPFPELLAVILNPRELNLIIPLSLPAGPPTDNVPSKL